MGRELGDTFIAVEFPGPSSAMTEHRQQEVDRVLAFFDEKLRMPTDPH